jgi:16S rRNA U1498 N3-methylase RsmE
MTIGEVVTLEKLLELEDEGERMKEEGNAGDGGANWVYLAPDGVAITSVSSFILHPSSFLLIGPEGGWTDGEIVMMQDRGLTGVRLTTTILRVETAAIAAAAVVACLQQQPDPS